MAVPGPTVHIVEDDLNVLKVLRAMVDAYLHPHRIVTAPTLCRARTALAHAVPDIALVDLWLPDGEGVDLIREIRMDARSFEARVIAITGHDSPSVRAMAFAAGCDAFLAKPFNAAGLVAAVHGVPQQTTDGRFGRDDWYEGMPPDTYPATFVRDRVLDVLRSPPGTRHCLSCIARAATVVTPGQRHVLRDLAQAVRAGGDSDIEGSVGECESCQRPDVPLLRLRTI